MKAFPQANNFIRPLQTNLLTAIYSKALAFFDSIKKTHSFFMQIVSAVPGFLITPQHSARHLACSVL